ncbi:Uu.00g039590.m01.CDS01 [Anthostomella pinea]|uniref:Uu.00g039590.m01.CDS01 n=1 Tax=Anthostomella pinea TaxID=933095 RepID=A0AAI8YDR7_9PEZI|nr:Uu.00g039590.m01.CDS01 [Anthostomella pinea]
MSLRRTLLVISGMVPASGIAQPPEVHNPAWNFVTRKEMGSDWAQITWKWQPSAEVASKTMDTYDWPYEAEFLNQTTITNAADSSSKTQETWEATLRRLVSYQMFVKSMPNESTKLGKGLSVKECMDWITAIDNHLDAADALVGRYARVLEGLGPVLKDVCEQTNSPIDPQYQEIVDTTQDGKPRRDSCTVKMVVWPGAFAFGLMIIGAVLISRLLIFLVRGSSQRLPPGPKPLPIIGNLRQLPKSLQWLHFYHWSKKYGPIMHLSVAGQPLIILSTNQAAQDLLGRRSAQYSDRSRMVMAGELVTKNMHMLIRPYDAAYRLHQRMEAPLLNAKAASCYRPPQELEARQLLFDLLGEYNRYGEEGVDFHHHFERAMASFIYCLQYGYGLKTGHEKALLDAKRVQGEFARTGQVGAYLVDTLPWLNYLPRALAPWKREGEELYELERALHVGNLEKGLDNPGWNFTKHMRNSKEATDVLTEELAFDLGIMADAALDTSTKLLDEVVGRGRLPEFNDRGQLAYIDAIVSETLRWRSVVKGGVPHFTKEADSYMGYHIPANSIVMGYHHAITRDESVFGEKVDAFAPERWLAFDDDNDGQTLKDLPQTGFGFGRRICTGRNIARNGLFIEVARLLWAFDVEPGLSESTGQRYQVNDMDCTEGFVTMPKPFRAVLRPMGPWVRDVIKQVGTTHAVDHVAILDEASRNRASKREMD